MRIVSIIAVCGLVACGPGRSTFARYPGASTTFERSAQDPKALEIADRVVAAAGGAESWARAKQLRWSQTVTYDGKVVVAGEQAWDRWNGRHHGRLQRDEGDVVVMRPIYEQGGHAFLDRDQRLRKLDDSTEAVAAARERWEFDTAILFMPFLLEEPGTKLEYVGERAGDDGKVLDTLKITFDPKDRTRTATYQVSVSRETNLIERIEIQKAGKSDGERLGYAITQWIDATGGLKVPAAIQNLGLKEEVVTFKNVTAAEPDDVLYVPPV